MLYWALIFFVAAIVAGIYGLGGGAAMATIVAWLVSLVALVLAAVCFLMGRRPPRL